MAGACSLAAAGLLAAAPAGLAAAQAGAGWNDPEALALVERAVARRQGMVADAALEDYRAHATGHVYFLFDLGPGTTRHLVKADQIALELYWRAPGETRQVIVGHREEKLFPTDIHYHIDHLTVVMDNFGDRIRLGEGDEVRDALHPAAPGAPDFYDYRFADSLTLRLPDGEIRVLALEVRPKDLSQPGFVGSIYLDRATAYIVRMDFTFTSASYLDRQLRYIHVVLENTLWQRRYWLPWRQGLELRRELKWLDFPAGGVIRAEFRIGGYEFNRGVPEGLFRGPAIRFLPPAARARYTFERDLYAALREDELRLRGDLAAVTAQAVEVAGRRHLEGLAKRPRLWASGVSSWLRYRRAEGVYAGLGASVDLGSWRLAGAGGRAFGAGRFEGEARVELHSGVGRLWVEGYGRRPEDVAARAAAPGAIQTVGALASGEDYTEPYFASGAEVGVARPWAGGEWGLFARWERHEPAELAAGETFADGFRPVRAMRAGSVGGGGVFAGSPARVGLGPIAGWDWRARGSTFGGDFEYSRLWGRVRHGWVWPQSGIGLAAELHGGAAVGSDLPPQALFPVGGRGTLRGYDFHEFVGSRYAAASAGLSLPLVRPWVTIHAFADAAWAEAGDGAADALARWNAAGAPARPTGGVRTGVGLGLGLVYDILRIEAARGLRDGGWEWIVTAHPAFWPWM